MNEIQKTKKTKKNKKKIIIIQCQFLIYNLTIIHFIVLFLSFLFFIFPFINIYFRG